MPPSKVKIFDGKASHGRVKAVCSDLCSKIWPPLEKADFEVVAHKVGADFFAWIDRFWVKKSIPGDKPGIFEAV